MIPQEKAKQLIERFYLSLPNNGSFSGINNVGDRWEEGIKCALIAVHEIIKEISDNYDTLHAVDRVEYFEQVKQEIGKISASQEK
jgi:hypothetical protein